jgi:hypothetical protein
VRCWRVFQGLGIGGASHGTGTPIFGVLNSTQSSGRPVRVREGDDK